MKLITAVTGSSGFIGRAVCSELLSRGYPVRAVVRSQESTSQHATGLLETVAVGAIGATTDWSTALTGVGCVIHCAARAHVMKEREADSLAAYREVNVAGTQRLAERAVALGVKRLVFVSSIKVNGERTAPNTPFLTSSVPAPEDAYGQSKWEAEQVLHNIAACTGMEIVIVRPPLVYGPGVKGNFARLLRLLYHGLPLPLGGVENLRSLVGIDNLVDLLIRCADHPRATGQTLLVSDGEDLSTPELVKRIATVMGKSPRLIPLPVHLLRIAGQFTGRLTEIDRLVSSLQVDSSHTCEILTWKPPSSIDEGLKQMVLGKSMNISLNSG